CKKSKGKILLRGFLRIDDADLDSAAIEARDDAACIEPLFLQDLVRIKGGDVSVNRLKECVVAGIAVDGFRHDAACDGRHFHTVRSVLCQALVNILCTSAIGEGRARGNAWQ